MASMWNMYCGGVFNDNSQGSIAKHLRCDELLYYIFIIQSTGERTYKIGEHLATLQAKWFIIPTKAFARDYGITGVGLSVCFFVTTITK